MIRCNICRNTIAAMSVQEHKNAHMIEIYCLAMAKLQDLAPHFYTELKQKEKEIETKIYPVDRR